MPAGATASLTTQVQLPASGEPSIRLHNTAASVRVGVEAVPNTEVTPPPAIVAPTGTYGVPTGITLRRHDGDISVGTAGTVLNGLDIYGVVRIEAPNVTIKNSKIRGRAGGGALIQNGSGFANLVVMDSEVFASPDRPASGIMGYNVTALRVNMHDVEDMVHITGSNVFLTNSWFHNNIHFERDPRRNYTPTHDDTIQVQTGSNIVVTGNVMTGAHNAALMITQDRGKVSQVTLRNNKIDGGACSVNVAEKGLGPIVGLQLTDNTFGRNTTLANCAIIAPTTTVVGNVRNFYTDGVAVTVRKGA